MWKTTHKRLSVFIVFRFIYFCFILMKTVPFFRNLRTCISRQNCSESTEKTVMQVDIRHHSSVPSFRFTCTEDIQKTSWQNVDCASGYVIDIKFLWRHDTRCFSIWLRQCDESRTVMNRRATKWHCYKCIIIEEFHFQICIFWNISQLTPLK